MHNPPISHFVAAFSNYSISCNVLLLIPYPKNVSCPISGMSFILKTVSLNPPGSTVAYMKGKNVDPFFNLSSFSLCEGAKHKDTFRIGYHAVPSMR